MGEAKKLALLGACALCAYMLWSGPDRTTAQDPPPAVQTNEQTAPKETSPEKARAEEAQAALSVPASAARDWEGNPFISSRAEEAIGMRIGNDALIRNETSFEIDVPEIVRSGTELRLGSGQPQILIIHTHSSEAYTQAGLDRYEESDSCRTEDSEHNIIRVGDELARLLEDAGLNVLHDRGVYDYPSYTGSYTRSGTAVEGYLSEYPSIRIVLDVHRDALGTDGVIYKTVAEEEGTCASQAMLLVGTDESGLEHPGWRQNLSLALYLQNAVLQVHPTLMRPVAVVPQRYNQQLCPGMLILEVGSSGNTMQEALSAVRLFAQAAAPALLELQE